MSPRIWSTLKTYYIFNLLLYGATSTVIFFFDDIFRVFARYELANDTRYIWGVLCVIVAVAQVYALIEHGRKGLNISGIIAVGYSLAWALFLFYNWWVSGGDIGRVFVLFWVAGVHYLIYKHMRDMNPTLLSAEEKLHEVVETAKKALRESKE